MGKLYRIILIFLCFSLLFKKVLNGQVYLLTDNFYTSADSNYVSSQDIYNNLNAFNFIQKKTTKTHILDSIVSYQGAINTFRKSQYIIYKDKQHVFRWNLDTSTQSWVPDVYLTYHYNEEKLISEYTYNPEWDGDINNLNESNPHILRKWFYDEDLLLVRFEGQDLLDIANNVIGNLELYEYDDNNNLSVFSRYFYDQSGDSSYLFLNAFYNHNNSGLLESASLYRYDRELNPMPTDSLYIEYNDWNLKTFEKDFYWKDSIFVLEELRTFSYDTQNRIDVERHFESYDSTYGDWQEADLFIYDYYPFGSLKSIVEFDSSRWNYGDMEKVSESNFEYDSSVTYNNIKLLRLFDQGYYENHMVLRETETGPFVDRKYYYSPYTTSTTNTTIDINTVSVIPNPSSDFIRFDLPESVRHNSINVKLMDVNGQVVIEKTKNSNEPIDIRGLDAGIYFYVLEGGKEGLFSGRFVKL